MLSSIRHTIASLPPLRGRPVLAAVSAGADSTALALALREVGADLSLAHVHHGIRGSSANADLDAARDLAARLDVPFHFARLDVPAAAASSRDSLEMAARRLRRRFLLDTALAHSIPFVATGHTASDQAETVLLRLARGTSPAGLAAIRRVVRDPCHPGVTWLRPLLDTPHDALVADLRRRGIPWREDPSNVSRKFARNRVRHDLLPALAAALNPRAAEALARLADLAAAESDLLDALGAAFAIPDPSDRLDALDALATHPALHRRRALANLLSAAPSRPPTCRDVLAAAIPPPPSTPRPLPPIWTIGPNLLPSSSFRIADLSSEAPLLLWRASDGTAIHATLSTGWTPSPSVISISLAPLPPTATLDLRRPLPGDRLPLPSRHGSKKLSDLFTDLKFPRPLRPLSLLLTLDGTPVALPAYRLAPDLYVPSAAAPSLCLSLSPSPD